MKHLYIIIAATFLLQSCKKNDAVQKMDQSLIIGNWELSKVYGGTTAADLYPAGNGNELEFTATNYKQISNHDLVGSGKFQIAEDTAFNTDSLNPGKYLVLDKLCFAAAPGTDCHFIQVDEISLIVDATAPMTGGRAKLYLRKPD